MIFLFCDWHTALIPVALFISASVGYVFAALCAASGGSDAHLEEGQEATDDLQ